MVDISKVEEALSPLPIGGNRVRNSNNSILL